MNKYNLFFGDYRDKIKANEKFDLILTSPPYNIGSKMTTTRTNRRYGGYDRKSWGAIEEYPDSVPEEKYQRQQKDFLSWCSRAIKPNGVIIYNHKPRHREGRVILPTSWFPDQLDIHDIIVWDRGSTHNHSPHFTYPQSERLYILKRPGAAIYFKNQPFYWMDDERKGVGDVWNIPRAYNNGHNAPFPLKLARQCIRMWCPPKGIVCDPYTGSGTTMIAAYFEDRGFVGAEILEKYHVLALNNFKETCL